jgi:hypothetical protein
MTYGLGVLATAAMFRLHRLGVTHSRLFQREAGSPAADYYKGR